MVPSGVEQECALVPRDGNNDYDQGWKQIATVLVSSQSELGARSEAFQILRALSMGRWEMCSELL